MGELWELKEAHQHFGFEEIILCVFISSCRQKFSTFLSNRNVIIFSKCRNIFLSLLNLLDVIT